MDSSCHDEVVHAHLSSGRKNADDRRKDLSISQNAFSFEDSQFVSTSILSKVYDIYGFEPLQNLDLGIFKLLKECTFKFIGSDRVMKMPDVVEKQSHPLSQMRVSILHGINSLLVAIDREAGVPGIHADFSIKGCSMQLNGFS